MKTPVCFVMRFDHPILRASYPKGGSGGAPGYLHNIYVIMSTSTPRNQNNILSLDAQFTLWKLIFKVYLQVPDVQTNQNTVRQHWQSFCQYLHRSSCWPSLLAMGVGEEFSTCILLPLNLFIFNVEHQIDYGNC